MADKLTPQQAEAVQNRGGKLLVSAAAGSGKTKVLVDRLLSYLTDSTAPANLDEFLIITYTKAAASELRGKIAAKLTERIAQEPENRHLQKQMQRLFLTNISTVHGFCGNLLREYAYRLDLSADFRVADENECQELKDMVLTDLLEHAYETMGEDAAFCAFVDSQGVGRNDGQVPEIVQKVYNSARCHLDPDGWLDSCLKNVSAEGIRDAGDTVWGRYLMDELFWYLDGQLSAIQNCISKAARVPGLEKVTDNLQGLAAQLTYLRSSTTWDEIADRKQIDYGRLTFPRKNPDALLAEEIKAVRGACKDGLDKKLRFFTDKSAQILKDLGNSALAAQGLVHLVRQFGEAYRVVKQQRHVLDFGDLEHKTLELLLGKHRDGITAAAREIGKRFREVMVDEYQDSNGVQDAIFTALTQERQNCFMVGDVKQSIYQFRLADPGIFLEKYNTYLEAAEAEPGQGRRVLLSHNFRSGGEVIEGINDVFSACMSPRVGGLHYTQAEALREGVPHIPLPDSAVELYALETEEDTYAEEAAFAAQCIRNLLETGKTVRDGDGLRPVTPDDIVILLRSPGSVGKDFQAALEAVGIRCAIDGGMDLLQTEEVSTLRSFLRTIANPRQDIPLLSTLASPLFGFTADELAAIRGKHRKGCIYDALEASDSPKAAAFLQTLKLLRQESRMDSLTQILERCFTLTRLDSIYGAMPGGKARKENLQMFYQLAADYEKSGIRPLGQFLEYLDSLQSGGLAAGSSTAGCVRIMSIHKSKGLEFPVVLLCGLSRRFNQESMRQQVLYDKTLGLGLMAADNQNRVRYNTVAKRAIAVSMEASGISEELRVLYVAMTRARDRLIMTYAARNLENALTEITLRQNSGCMELLCAEAACPGDWVLAEAIQRTEAGALHALGGIPNQTHTSTYPWKISVVETKKPESVKSVLEESRPEQAPFSLEELRSALAFRYAHMAATVTPSKQTATGRKAGSRAEEEAMEQTQEAKPTVRAWRKPAFRTEKRDAKAYGNAFHSAMQFLRFEECRDCASVEQEIQRLVSEGFLSAAEGDMVDCRKIAAFFASPMGQRLRSGVPYLREFKFSLLDNAERYGQGLEGESVLLQGVVDCAILEPDGIVLLDYKTDYVTDETVCAAAQRHRRQLETYADALSRIFERPVTEKYIYFFQINRFWEIT